MSYCRYSDMNWRCDVYVYEHVGGYWVTHVAMKRKVIPPIPDLMMGPLSIAQQSSAVPGHSCGGRMTGRKPASSRSIGGRTMLVRSDCAGS